MGWHLGAPALSGARWAMELCQPPPRLQSPGGPHCNMIFQKVTVSHSAMQSLLHHHSFSQGQPQLGKGSMDVIAVRSALCNHRAVCQCWLGGFFSGSSFLSILQRFKLFSSFLKTLDWFYLVTAEGKCNSPIAGDVSALYAEEKRVQTALWMQKPHNTVLHRIRGSLWLEKNSKIPKPNSTPQYHDCPLPTSLSTTSP